MDDLPSGGLIESTFDDEMIQLGMEFGPALALTPGDPLSATLGTTNLEVPLAFKE